MEISKRLYRNIARDYVVAWSMNLIKLDKKFC